MLASALLEIPMLCVVCAASIGHAMPPMLADEELVSDRSLAVLADLICVVRSGKRVIEPAADADSLISPVSFQHSKLTAMLQVGM